ncbi:hypothetical protein AQPE_0394 [Aquipluma nitroreducens]|uniref:DUF4402 domain-containing protein n=1 Tax=Aquipluma nitroreducens TaxID=2010828 RepID=A0A5K7S427_9BACT|nr:DUF4402 domain-containing protein [Aquipluma nitroreducens]BBE16257.1 hypothetical protein AQPE_0394 [Aquipluma nitroreducens]
MKSLMKFFALAVAILGFSANSFGQESATANATGTIVTPIAIELTSTATNGGNMNFGNVAVQSSTAGTVELTPAGTRNATDGVTLPAVPGAVSAASFDVTGANSYTYSITLPSSTTTVTSGANEMTVDTWTSTPTEADGGTLNASGAQTIKVGATLHIAAAQPAGEYVSSTPFTVTVNYN